LPLYKYLKSKKISPTKERKKEGMKPSGVRQPASTLYLPEAASLSATPFPNPESQPSIAHRQFEMTLGLLEKSSTSSQKNPPVIRTTFLFFADAAIRRKEEEEEEERGAAVVAAAAAAEVAVVAATEEKEEKEGRKGGQGKG